MILERGDIELAKDNLEDDPNIYPEYEMLKKRLSWFEDLKLGVIFHYGLYSQAGIVESWQLSEKDEWARDGHAFRENIGELQLDYWNLISKFNPTQLNTDKWADVCKKAGIKYGIFSTKHHDGFNLFNTATSEYKVGGKLSPCKIDIFKEVMDSFRKKNISMGAYYSKADWFSPYYWLEDETIKGRNASYDTKKYPEIWNKYVSFVHEQIYEITHNYGKVDFLWLDAGWCGADKEDLQMDKLAEIAREKQKELIIVDRTMGGRHENYVTPERKVPDLEEIPKKPWESNIPIGNDWGYVPTDKFKSTQEIIELFIGVVSKGGNLILGVGPTPEGLLTEGETKVLLELGEWIDLYQEGIYETRARAELSVGEWKYTFSKDEKPITYAFRSISQPTQEKYYLSELGINDLESDILDLVTKKSLSVFTDETGSFIKSADIYQPKNGFIGLKIIKEK